ncbi:MAG: type II 3-dehydroquinate dehydratase [Gemmatimonadota bacterium]|nr:type II 3-dehydroquinate dehydratase [Gemmatimonadota bacterium]MDP6530179.1 type II 3-dehydroquinate dehydratase [Gemmatimonadota bacterium]MDP6802072.1 type II 3-dehydroquinate dehydratase [Gemmatimonadota bacterium]MDP7032452.1 type II 3-dehydroquinate dehydratase [Gemmatimonadota bacterium]
MTEQPRRRILVVHGANLELLGKREPSVYGSVTLAEIRTAMESGAARREVDLEWFSSNHEGEIVDALGGALGKVDGVVINPGGYTHTSVAIRDALLALSVPVVEVHISNIHAREDFRRESLISDVVTGTISGLGAGGACYALDALVDLLEGASLPTIAPGGRESR